MTGKKKARVRRKTSLAKGASNVAKEMQNIMNPAFLDAVANVLRAAHKKAFRTVNTVMVESYWNVGRMIVEEEQQGRKRAGYGETLIQALSERLTAEFGRGFSEANLRNFRQFYLCFPIRYTVCSESTDDSDISIQGSTEILHAPLGKSAKTDLNGEGASIPFAPRRELSWSHYRLIMRVNCGMGDALF